jgi:Ser/Thr protein kinase RdoA (MazF antagonist)
MQQAIIHQIINYFSLGEILGEPQVLTLGRLHHAWRLHTRKGYFLVKKINFDYWKFAYAEQNYFVGERIAKKLAENHIPVRYAIFKNSSSCIEIENNSYMVYPWIVGEPISIAKINKKQLKSIARTLAHIHQSRIDMVIAKPRYFNCSEKDWQEKINASVAINTELKDLLNIEELSKLTKKSYTACRELENNLVISHRDLDWSNVIWQNDQPVIIDWELAGLINPWREAIALALSWSLVHANQFKANNFKILLEEYCNIMQSQPTAEEQQLAFAAVFNDWLGWMYYHLCQAKPQSVIEIKNTWKSLQTVLHTVPGWGGLQADSR